MKSLSQFSFLKEQESVKKKMGRCQQVHIQIKEPFYVLSVANQVQSRFHCQQPLDNLPQLYVFQLKKS